MKYLFFIVPILFFACGSDEPIEKNRPMSAYERNFYMTKWMETEKKKNFENTFYVKKQFGCCPRYLFAIKANKKGEFMVGREIIKVNHIKKSTVDYLTRNMQVRGTNLNSSPLYTFSSKEYISKNIDKYIERIKLANKAEFSQQAIDVLIFNLNQNQDRLKALETLGFEELTEIDPTAIIDVYYQNVNDNYLVDTVLAAYLHIRDSLSKHHFQEPFLEIYKRSEIIKDSLDLDKLKALEILMPTRFIDWPNENKYKHMYKTFPITLN